MSGEALYFIYVQSMSRQGIGVDAWGDLDHEDRVAWGAVSTAIEDQAEMDREVAAEYEGL
jgi:hypothetical protein